MVEKFPFLFDHLESISVALLFGHIYLCGKPIFHVFPAFKAFFQKYSSFLLLKEQPKCSESAENCEIHGLMSNIFFPLISIRISATLYVTEVQNICWSIAGIRSEERTN